MFIICGYAMRFLLPSCCVGVDENEERYNFLFMEDGRWKLELWKYNTIQCNGIVWGKIGV